MSGELDETQLVNCLLPIGRGNRSVGTELEMALGGGVRGDEDDGSLQSSVGLMVDRSVSFERRCRTVAGVSDW
jgi:hypothetical protein